MNTLFRALPSVDALLIALADKTALPRNVVRDTINTFLDECRLAIKEGRIQDEKALKLKT